jgi:hypothetical protein
MNRFSVLQCIPSSAVLRLHKFPIDKRRHEECDARTDKKQVAMFLWQGTSACTWLQAETKICRSEELEFCLTLKCVCSFRLRVNYMYKFAGEGARGSVVGWGTMLQAGRSWVLFPMKLLKFFFNLPNPSSHNMALESTQPLTEMSTRNIPGV